MAGFVSPGATCRTGFLLRRSTWIVVLVVIGIVAVAVGIPLLWGSASPSPPPWPPPVTAPTMNASLVPSNSSPVALATGFLGVNVAASSTHSASAWSAAESTSVRMFRWPGGAEGDRFDPLANGGQGLLYSDSGASAAPKTSLAGIAAWCRSVACRSIVTLPAEIANASEAAAIVRYSEGTLGFWPSFWEIGDEPALWTHSGIPWGQWNTSQNATPTPSQYASVVQHYVAAIRSVDPTTPLIGLGGVGPGTLPESSWISETVRIDGPNLSAIAIHVYPAGPGFPPQDLPDWFGTLSSHSALPYRVDRTLSLIEAACASCHLAVLVDEFQTGTRLTASDALSGGYLATYVAAELVQAFGLPIASLDYYDLQSGTPGAWFNPEGAVSPAGELYQALGEEFGAYARPLNVTSTASGLLVASGGNASARPDNLLVVNTNASVGFHLNLSAAYPNAAQGSAWEFVGSAGAPVTGPIGPMGARNRSVPPASVTIFHGIGSLQGPGAARLPGGVALPSIEATSAGAGPATALAVPGGAVDAGLALNGSLAVWSRQ